MAKKTKLVYGVGINDADYFVTKKENGKRVMCPYYRTWKSMLMRAYSDKFKQIQPTYEGVTVCEQWHSFMRFRAWMIEQDWKGKELDKDILFQGNKVYSPDTCVFVDSALNSFLTDSAAARGEWPIGVYWNEPRQKFQSRCGNPLTKKRERILACSTAQTKLTLLGKSESTNLLASLLTFRQMNELQTHSEPDINNGGNIYE